MSLCLHIPQHRAVFREQGPVSQALITVETKDLKLETVALCALFIPYL